MTALLFDAESSGLWRDGLPADHPSQPHLLQIGAKLIADDGRRIHRWTALVKPDGWNVEAEATAVHGISERRAYRYGLPLLEAIRPLRLLAPMAKTIVGHGIQNFDRRLIDAELIRLNANGAWWSGRGDSIFDTMEAAMDICRLPGEFGFKFPSLEEAHAFFFPDAGWKSSHDAEDDLEATQRVFFAIKNRLASPR